MSTSISATAHGQVEVRTHGSGGLQAPAATDLAPLPFFSDLARFGLKVPAERVRQTLRRRCCREVLGRHLLHVGKVLVQGEIRVSISFRVRVAHRCNPFQKTRITRLVTAQSRGEGTILPWRSFASPSRGCRRLRRQVQGICSSGAS